MVLKMSQRFSIGTAMGQGLNEYGLILGLVVILAIPGLMLLGNQSKGGVDAVNDNADEMKDMVNVLNNQTPGGQSLVNRPALPTPLIDIGGQSFQFQLNSNTGLVEPAAGNGGITEESGRATNTTSSLGRISQQLVADIQQESQLLAELGLGGDLEKVLAGTNFFRDKQMNYNMDSIGQNVPRVETSGPQGGPIPGGGGRPILGGGSLSAGNGETPVSTITGLNGFNLPGLDKSFDLNKPLSIKPSDINLSSLDTRDQAWFGEFFMLQQNTLSIIKNPTLVQTKPELVDKLKLNLQMTFYNQFLPKLKSDPSILKAAFAGTRVSSNK